jgi:hypothetical protein
MDRSKKTLNFSMDKLVLAQLTEDELANAAVYVNDELLPAGASVMGGVELQSDEPHWIAFIDQTPRANWMHRCRYLVIERSERVISVQADRPPVFGSLPSGWRLVWRAPGIEEWMLLPGVNKTGVE